MSHRQLVVLVGLLVPGLLLPPPTHGVPGEPAPCVETDPVECPGDGGPVFRLGFRGPCSAAGDEGSTQVFDVFATIETHCLEPGSAGAQGWALSIRVRGCSPILATTQGTAAALTTEGGLRNPESSFEKTEVLDPSRAAGAMGVVSAVALDLDGLVTLPPEESPHDVLQVTLTATVPAGCGECIVRHEDGLHGTGQPVRNFLTYQRAGYEPPLTEIEIELCSADGGELQKPGDENQDGEFNLSDPVSVLNHLFVGSNPTLPCGDGTIADEANLAILDLNGSGEIDVSDPVYALNFLFSGGLPPVMGKECLRVQGCPEGCAS